MKRISLSKINIPMLIASILLCLTLITTHITGGLFAKYVYTGNAGDDARVAVFSVSEEGASFTEDLLLRTTPGTEELEITISNDSEVQISCTLTVINSTNNIPFEFSVNGGGTAAAVFEMAAGEEKTVPLSVSWDENGALEYMGMVDLAKVTLEVQQVD